MTAPHPPHSPLTLKRQSPAKLNLAPPLNAALEILLRDPAPTRTPALGTLMHANGGSLPVLGMVTQNFSVRHPPHLCRTRSRMLHKKRERGGLTTMAITVPQLLDE